MGAKRPRTGSVESQTLVLLLWSVAGLHVIDQGSAQPLLRAGIRHRHLLPGVVCQIEKHGFEQPVFDLPDGIVIFIVWQSFVNEKGAASVMSAKSSSAKPLRMWVGIRVY